MLMEKERRQVVSYGCLLLKKRLTLGTAGNISAFDSGTGLLAISPSGMAYEDTEPEDVVVCDLNGNVVEGARKPSSELGLHAALYRVRPEIGGVVHTHSMYATTLACMNEPIRPIHFAILSAGEGEVPLADYATFGTPELAEAAARAVGSMNAVLLRNHGILTLGKDIPKAFQVMEDCEWCAEVQWRCMCAGKPSVLTGEQLADAARMYRGYGQKK
ncbi:MAG: class II aldolase/adducin family protein [Lachnospiraceae bacterium]